MILVRNWWNTKRLKRSIGTHFPGLNLPIVNHLIQEVHPLTQSQGLVQQDHTLTQGPSAAHTLAPIHHHPHTTGEAEAEARATITVQVPDLMDTTDLGQGHLPIEDTTEVPHLLQHLGDSLPLNVMYLKEKQIVSILIDTEKFHHFMTSKPIMGRVLTLETHLRKNATRNGEEIHSVVWEVLQRVRRLHRVTGTPRKAHSKSAKEHQDLKEDKVKRDSSKDIKSEKPASKDEKDKKPEKNKVLDSKGEKWKRKTEEIV